MSNAIMFRRPLSAVRLFWLALALCSVFAPARATVMRYLTIEELTQTAAHVIQGEVLSTKVYWDDSHTRILTAVRVQIKDTLKGATKTGDIVTITQAGGELDGLRQEYSGRPHFRVGEQVVLFTRPGRQNDQVIIGLKQGLLRVQGADAVRDFSGITLVDQSAALKTPRRVATANGQPVQVQTRLSLAELRQRVAQVR